MHSHTFYGSGLAAKCFRLLFVSTKGLCRVRLSARLATINCTQPSPHLKQGTRDAFCRLWYHRRVSEDAVQDVLPDEFSWLPGQPERRSSCVQLVHEAPVLPEIHRRPVRLAQNHLRREVCLSPTEAVSNRGGKKRISALCHALPPTCDTRPTPRSPWHCVLERSGHPPPRISP